MAIDEDTRATIMRLWRAEGWPVGTIARHCGVHHSTVTRVLRGSGVDRPPRRALIDDFVPFIKRQLADNADLPASTLYKQVQARGYRGGEDHFRHVLRARGLRPVKRREPSIRMRFLPAEQGQVDWAEFGRVRIGRATHTLMGLLVTLSYSRQTFLSLFYDARMPSFLQGHVDAFAAFGGVPRELMYDNLKSAVVTRRGSAVTFNPQMIALAGHYAFTARAAWPRSPREKARVERRVGFARTSFFAGRDIAAPLDELNAAAREWCLGPAAQRPWPDDDSMTVADAFAREREMLVALPRAPFPADEIRSVSIDQTCYARYQANDYSVPGTCATATLTLVASRDTVRILDAGREVARHERCYDRFMRISDPAHIKDIAARKRRARAMSQRDRLLTAVPRAEDMLARAGQHNENVGTIARTLLTLLDTHGADELDRAIAIALARRSHHPNTVRHLLETRRARRGLPQLSLADSGTGANTGSVRGTDPAAYDAPKPDRKRNRS